MQTADSSPQNKRYNDEVMLLEGLYEFHPEFFDELGADDRAILKEYYLVDGADPENIFEYRQSLLAKNPGTEAAAHTAFARLCKIAGIQNT